MKREKKKKGFYRTVAKAIMEGAPFDVSKNDGGFTKVSELIALYMLRDLNDANRFRVWNDYLTRIEGILNKAIHYINENPDNISKFRNVHIHVHRPENKRNNEFLSLKINYRKSLERNTDRLIRRIETTVRPAIKEIKVTQPERLKESQNKTKLLLTGSI